MTVSSSIRVALQIGIPRFGMHRFRRVGVWTRPILYCRNRMVLISAQTDCRSHRLSYYSQQIDTIANVERAAWKRRPKDPGLDCQTPAAPPRLNLTKSLIGASVVALLMGYTIVTALTSGSLTSAGITETSQPTGRPKQTAASFDRTLDREEWKTGIAELRRRLRDEVRGHVLEVACGTGRNLEMYSLGSILEKGQEGTEEERLRVKSFTAMDISSDMLDVAADRLKRILPTIVNTRPKLSVERDSLDNKVISGHVEYLDGAIRLVKGNALDFLPKPYEGATQSRYDTVIQTFGLCSVSNPKRILMNLAMAVKPDTGRIILMEHGRGIWWPINWWLDRLAPKHFESYGCWWNRDIEKIVRGMVNEVDGIEIVELSRPPGQLGTVLWIELRVKKLLEERVTSKAS